MVESGPFIEYCCELYIHHDVMNIVIAAVMVFSALLVFGIGIFAYYFSKKHNTLSKSAQADSQRATEGREELE